MLRLTVPSTAGRRRDPCRGRQMIEPRTIVFEPDAVSALFEILEIMTDQLMVGNMIDHWDTEAVFELQMRFAGVGVGEPLEIGINDAALLLDGMAFTETMSVDLPFVEMVRWTSDFITAELRSHWTEEQWLAYVGR